MAQGAKMWIPPEEKEPVLLHEPTRKSVGYFGAIRLRDGKFVFRREEDKFNGMSFRDFMKGLRMASCHSGRKVLAIADNALYHRARLQRILQLYAKG